MDSKKKIYVLKAWNYDTDKIEVFYTLSEKKAQRKWRELVADEGIRLCLLEEFDLF